MMKTIKVTVKYPLGQDEDGKWYDWYGFSESFACGATAIAFVRKSTQAVVDINGDKCPIEYVVDGHPCAFESISKMFRYARKY